MIATYSKRRLNLKAGMPISQAGVTMLIGSKYSTEGHEFEVSEEYIRECIDHRIHWLDDFGTVAERIEDLVYFAMWFDERQLYG